MVNPSLRFSLFSCLFHRVLHACSGFRFHGSNVRLKFHMYSSLFEVFLLFLTLLFLYNFLSRFFGTTVPDFRSFQASFSMLLRYPLGDFSYETLLAARPDVAAIFFSLYMAIVFIVSMNMVVSIRFLVVSYSP